MFKISKYSESDGIYSVSVQFKFIDHETIEVSGQFSNKKAAMQFFGEYAIEYLRGQIDEFTKVIKYIKPHYFDRSRVPFVYLGNAWRDSYHPYMYSVLMKLSDLYHRPGEYAQTVLHYHSTFKSLIPSMRELGSLECNYLFTEIMTTAGKVIELVQKINDYKKELKKAV